MLTFNSINRQSSFPSPTSLVSKSKTFFKSLQGRFGSSFTIRYLYQLCLQPSRLLLRDQYQHLQEGNLGGRPLCVAAVVLAGHVVVPCILAHRNVRKYLDLRNSHFLHGNMIPHLNSCRAAKPNSCCHHTSLYDDMLPPLSFIEQGGSVTRVGFGRIQAQLPVFLIKDLSPARDCVLLNQAFELRSSRLSPSVECQSESLKCMYMVPAVTKVRTMECHGTYELHTRFLHIRVFSDKYMQLVHCHTSPVDSMLTHELHIRVFFYVNSLSSH